MLMDFKLEGKTVIVVGGGMEAFRKTQSFIDSGAKITVISKDFSDGIKQLAEEKKITLQKASITEAKTFFNELSTIPDVFLAVTNNSDLNTQLVRTAKIAGCLVYSVDNPSLSDFILPAVAKIGDVKIAVSTSGKSPAVAKELRQRIEQLVSAEDLLQIELQAYLREILKLQVADQKVRSRLLNDILNNVEIKQVLNKNQLDEAKKMAVKHIESWRSSN